MALITCPECKTGNSRPMKRLLLGLAAAILVCVMTACSPGGGDAPDAPSSPSSAAVGDIVTFGSFNQSAKSDVGEKPIEWRVLAVEGDRMLLVSVCALDCRPFNSSDKQGNSWEESDLYAWLTTEFNDSAFTEAEQERILEITCLSVDEARAYFADDAARACKPTAYAATNGAVTSNGGCYWWLRSAGTNGKEYAAFVSGDGRVMAGGQPVSNTDRAVRPAMWVALS